MVWDTIFGRAPESEPADEWGGIAYALASLESSLPDDWEIVPLIKVGRDLTGRANTFLNDLTRRSASARFIEVPEPNNRVTLRYESDARRCEHLSGGVPPWTWAELGPMVADLNAMYVNFISGFEMTLDTASYLRRGFAGAIYADLHSLFLGVGPEGLRVPQPLAHSDSWFTCFDVVQVNEEELALLGEDSMSVAAHALAAGVRLLIVTLGPRGAVYFTAEPFDFLHRDRPTADAPIRTARIPADPLLEPGDPTGCGDVFGAALVAGLLRGDDVSAAIAGANQSARRNLTHRGATNLQFHLRGEIAPT